MRGQVLVSLLVTGVLGNEVEVFAADDDGTMHLGRNDGAGKDTTTDGNLTSEGALLVCNKKFGQSKIPSCLIPCDCFFRDSNSSRTRIGPRLGFHAPM